MSIDTDTMVTNVTQSPTAIVHVQLIFSVRANPCHVCHLCVLWEFHFPAQVGDVQ